jgi:hypothetical protein
MLRQLVAGVLASLYLFGVGGATAATWPAGLLAGSNGQAAATGAPSAPTGATSACTSTVGSTVNVTWSLVARATSYDIWQSQTSATSGFTLVATGVSATTWTSGSLATGSYWFEVSARTGANWTGPTSTATAKRTISVTLCT